uniref:Uncharacterized protein n=1 Tax=Arundo donax TaxID=35708 RepID=A0A0A8Z3X8_ARUDO
MQTYSFPREHAGINFFRRVSNFAAVRTKITVVSTKIQIARLELHLFISSQ